MWGRRAGINHTSSELTSTLHTALIIQDDISAKQDTPAETPGSPALSTTSTVEGGSSPVLPPLPTPTIYGRSLNLFKTPPPEPRRNSIPYYTASWGSPYLESCEVPLSADNRVHRKSFSSDTSEDSPLRRLALHTPYLRPAPGLERSQTQPAVVTQDGLSAAVLVNRVHRPALGLTEDWIRAHIDGDQTTERLNWLSDSNAYSEASSEGEGSIEVVQDVGPKTPTLKSFVERRNKARENPSHLRSRSTATITQADFKEEAFGAFAEMATPIDNIAVDPLGEMAIARNASARKYIGHTRNASTASPIKTHIASQLDIRDPHHTRPSISSFPDTTALLEVDTVEDVGNGERHLETTSPGLDKELPPPPPIEAEVRLSEAVDRGADSSLLAKALRSPSSAPLDAEPPLAAQSRVKKKFPWKGKYITIYIPLDDERGRKGKAPTPMTPGDVHKMLRDWEQLGYDVTGFNLGQSTQTDSIESRGQSRSMWPITETIIQERQAGKFRISIPDRREWEAYVEELREAKLRALGVSLGDDEPVPSVSSAQMSRQTSAQYGAYPPLPFSPPIPTSSTTSGSAHQHHNPFSPALIANAGPSTSQSSHVGSVASPASMHAQIYGKFNPRQSISLTGGENPFGSPYQFAQQSSPGVWSPQQMLYQPGLARGGSPSLQNLTTVISPTSPFSQDGYFQHADLAALQQHKQHLQNQLQLSMSQASARQSPRIHNIPEHDEHEVQKSPSKTPEASHFIKHNASDSLQKEIDEAEYHLEEQFQRQLEHEDYSPHSEKEDDTTDLRDVSAKPQTGNSSGTLGQSASHFAKPDSPVLHHPQPHSRGHSLSQRPFGVNEDAPSPGFDHFIQPMTTDTPDVGTDITTLDTPVLTTDVSDILHKRSFSSSSNPWADSEASLPEPPAERIGHASKPSVSKWNVAAPEFKFNPSVGFNPSQPAFVPGMFQPPVAVNSSFVPPVAPPMNGLLGNRGSIAKKINVAAPAFTPGQLEFSFSSSSPMFRPDAPAFTPKAVVEPAGSEKSSLEKLDTQNSIFGKIDMTVLDGIMKPPKKSKAIPIIRPDSTDNAQKIEDTFVEGLDDRITQGEGRNKRARGVGHEADSVPLFAEPSPEPPILPLQERALEQVLLKEPMAFALPTDDKENMQTKSDNDALRIVSSPAVNSIRARSTLDDSPDYDGRGWAPWDFQQQEARGSNIASFFPVRLPTQAESKLQENPAEKKNKENKVKSNNSLDESVVAEKPKSHKNSLSALAKPFEIGNWFKYISSSSPTKEAPAPEAVSVTNQKPTSVSEPLTDPVVPVVKYIKPSGGLSSSRYANSPPPPTPPPKQDNQSPNFEFGDVEKSKFQAALPPSQSPPPYSEEGETVSDREPTFEEIDAVMRQMNEEPELSVNRDTDTPRWHQHSPIQRPRTTEEAESSPVRFQPLDAMRSDAPSPSPRRFQPLPGDLPGRRVFSRVHDDPFVAESFVGRALESPVHNLNPQVSMPASDWDSVLSESEETKFQSRTQFFDNHVNDLVGGLLSDRLDPLERTLETIQLSLAAMSARTPSSRRRRSFSGELPESDADDEDDEQQGSTSPRKDRKFEKIKSIINEALDAHQSTPVMQPSNTADYRDPASVLQAIEELKDQFGQSMHLDLRGEDLRNIVEEAVERRMPSTPKEAVDESSLAKIAELEARISDMNLRTHKSDEKFEEEVKIRRAAEDRLAEVQRLLRISSEEETRLRELLDEKDQKIKSIDDTRSKSTMRAALLEANAQNAQKNQSDIVNKLAMVENDLRQTRQEAQRWQQEAMQHSTTAKTHKEAADNTNESNIQLRRAIESLKLQVEESLRVRETMRHKLGNMQEDMAKAAREMSQENAQRVKREQEQTARQEVLDARLQAEARTRERLEKKIEGLKISEREGARAIGESKRLGDIVVDLRKELEESLMNASRYQREFEEARESGLSEVQRTKNYMQAEIEAANNEVNMVRRDLEDQVSRLRGELDQIRLDADTAKARHEMLLEEAIETRRTNIDALARKHSDEIEDLQTRHERELGIATEDNQRSEQQLLERLSLSSAKMEHLQDRVSHLEERLEIAKAAALAAVQAAKSASVSSPEAFSRTSRKSISKATELPEKISPQALRESILVLQEQLQDREQTIEELEQRLSTVDIDAPNKISKRDDEISWLRELLAVRIADLQDIINTASEEDFDPAPVKDAAIRLKANLQMQQQERERAMSTSGMLPNIAASIKDAATPRVVKVVGPMAAAWGNWRKNQAEAAGSTPSKASPQSFLSGLLTPPASSVRTPSSQAQPTAFSNTGRRFTAQQLSNRPTRRQEKMPARDGPPSTPLMRKSSYDRDARAEDFREEGFFDDDADDNAARDIDDSILGVGR